jgi:hypothetical protein
VTLSILGLAVNPFYYSFFGLFLIERIALLKTVIKAVTKDFNKILMVFMLALVIMYIYSRIAFELIPDLYFDDRINQGIVNK